MSSFVTQISLERADQLKQGLLDQNFELSQPPYTLFQGKKKGVTCTLYTSGKLVVQGKQMQEFIQFYLEPDILKTFTFGYQEHQADLTARIGVDESGKGDFFGPLCIAAVYADEKSIPALIKSGVKDSKALTDQSILKIARQIAELTPFHLIRISPTRYNELYKQFGNLNTLLGWAHATVIEELSKKTGCHQAIIDQFAAEHVVENALKRKKLQIALTQRTKGEEDVVVAAASIIARASFVKGLEDLEKKWGIALPKGASQKTIQAGIQLVQKHGQEALTHTAKLHFKTTQQILDV